MANNFSKKFFRDVAYSISLILVFSFVIFGIGCKVGLGESIDAMAPTLSFTNPGLSSVLKDDIVISGEWNDDKGVNQIYVTIKDTESSKVIVSDELAQVVNDGTWTYTIFSKTSARAAETDTTVLSDGKYEVSIYAIDVGNHQSGIYSRTFEVDTQPPLVVLSKPNSVNIKDASTYGRKIQITGAVSDDHKVESLDIRVWKSRVNENGIVVPDDDKEITLPKSTFTNFDTSDMAVTIAQYWKNPPEDEESKALYDNYIAIYGSGNKEENPEFDTTQKFFIQISATDKSGNTSERVYAKSKLNNVLKQILADNGITNKTFEPNELKNILNGSYTGSLPADVLTEIENALYAKGKYEDVLANGYISDNLTWLAFTVNSKANPNYALDYKYSSGSWSEINKELPVSINLTAGLDGYEIHPDSLKVSLIPVDPITLNEIDDSKVHVIDVGLEKIYQDGNPLKTVDSQGNVELKTTTVTSAKYTFIPAELEELKAGYCYKIKVEGHDEEGLELYPLDDNDYGFKIQFTASVPQIQTQDFEDGDYVKAEDFYLENDKVLNFTVEDDDDMPMEFTASTYIASKRLVLSEINKMLEADPGLLVALDDFKKITLDSSSHYRIKDEKAYKITIPVVITPDALTSNFTVILRIDVVKDEVPTTKLFYFYADNAAPEMELSNAELKNWNGSDRIIITEQTPTLVLDTDKNSQTYGYYSYTINGTWKDAFGSGTKKVYWSIDSDDKATGTWTELSEDVAIQSNPGSDRPSSWTASFPLYRLEGIDRSINYYADDNVGNETEVGTYKNIVFDFGIPKIESAVLDEYYGRNEKPLEIIFDAKDTSKMADIKFEITKNGKPLTEEELKLIKVTKTPVTEEDIAKNAETGEVEWKAAGYDYRTEKVSKMSLKVEIPRDSTCDGLYTFTATATDIAGRQSAPLVRTTTIDCVAPKINDDLKVGNLNWSGTSYYKDLTLKMSGSFTESIGMDALYYYVQYPGRTGEVPADLTVLNEGKSVADGSVNFKQGATDFSFTVENYLDNTPTQANILYIQGIDKAGNKSEISSYTVNIDTSAPELSVVLYRVEGTNFKSTSGTVYANGTKYIAVYGNYMDEQSGVEDLVFTLNGEVFTPEIVNYSAQEITDSDTCKEILDAHAGERPVDTDEYNADDKKLWYLRSKFDKDGTTKTIKSWRAIFTPTEKLSGVLAIEGRNGTYTGEGNGGKTSIKSFTITMDKELPSLNNLRLLLAANKNAYSKTIGSGESAETVYYIHNGKEKNLTISGVSDDNTGVDTVTLQLTNPDGTATGIVKENTGSASVWKFEGLDFSNLTGSGVTAFVTAIDNAGNSITGQLKIYFDKSAPFSVHAIDAKNKDLYFRIGESNNDDITPETAANYYGSDNAPLVWDTNKDVDVGSKYSEGTYGNDNTIRIRGNFGDGSELYGSGVKMIYYKVFVDDPTEEEIDKVIALQNYTGYFAPLSTVETKRVFYNVLADEEDTLGGTILKYKDANGEFLPVTYGSGSTIYHKYFKDVDITYDSTLSGFTEGNNFVVIVAEDNVGNVGVSSVVIDVPDELGNLVATEYRKCTLNVDTVVPEITSNETEIKFTNGKNPISISGTVTDGAAGVKSLVIKVGDSQKTLNATLTTPEGQLPENATGLQKNLRNWSAQIDKDYFNDLESGNVTVYAIATDNAGTGNSTTISVATISIDKTAPTVKIISPSDADRTTNVIEVNRQIELSGTSNDMNSVDSVFALYYKLAENGEYPQIPANNTDALEAGWIQIVCELEGTTNWTAKKINTEKLDGQTKIQDGSTVYIIAAARDSAGNVGYSRPLGNEVPFNVVVDQNTDRPIVTFSNITLANTTNSESKPMSATDRASIPRAEIYGTVTDDDGEILSFELSFDYGTKGENAIWTNAKDGTDSWTYNFPTDGTFDGDKDIWIRVKDANERIFISSTGETAEIRHESPKITNKNQKNQYGYGETNPCTIVYASVDLIPPKIPEIYYTKTAPDASENLGILSGYTVTELFAKGWKQIETMDEFLGGPDSKIYLFVHATDANGIKSTSVKLGNDVTAATLKEHSAVLSKDYYALYELDTAKQNGVNIVLSITAIDKFDSSASRSSTLKLDNEAPTVTIQGYSNGATIFGSIDSNALNGISSDGSYGSGVTKIYYGVSTSKNTAPASYKEIQDYTNLLSWNIKWSIGLDGNPEAENVPEQDPAEYKDWILNHYLDALYEGYDSTVNTDNRTLCIWVKAEDKFGNCSQPQTLELNVIPQGDKPVVTIGNPENEKKVGGTIRITGSTSIGTTAVSKVYIQIEPDYDKEHPDNAFNGWADKVSSLILNKGCDYLIEDTEIPAIGKAILAKGSPESWRLPINAKKEFDKKDENGVYVNREMAIRVYAINNATPAKVSDPVIITFTLDPGSPIFGDKEKIHLVQYKKDENGIETEEIAASRIYEKGMWIKGKWYIVGSVQDDSGIGELLLDGTSIISDASQVKPFEEDVTIEGENGQPDSTVTVTNYNLKIPVGSDVPNSYGSVTYDLEAFEASEENKSTPLKLVINYDNKAPEFTNDTLKTSAELAAGEQNKIVQSNGAYEIKGSLEEDGTESGFSRIAFYFTRTLTDGDNSTTYIIDPMLKQGTSGEDNRYNLADAGAPILCDKDGLYWRTVTCTASGVELTLKEGVDFPANVRDGGICKVDDVIYRIKSVNAAKKQITLETELSKEGDVSVDFAIAQIIDHTINETGYTTFFGDTGDKTSGSITNDDGDGMVEGYTETTGAWKVQINSKNILDGPVDVHFIAFDKAGNLVKADYPAIVRNNGPRIAGIIFGTDQNGNDELEESELISEWSNRFVIGNTGIEENGYDSLHNQITNMDIYNVDSQNNKTSVLTIKGKTIFKPEIVGGNKGIGWKYSVESVKAGETFAYSQDAYTQLTNSHSTNAEIRPIDGTDGTKVELTVLDLLKAQIPDGEKKFTLSFRDYTEGTTAQTTDEKDIQKATFNIWMNVAIGDEKAPTAEINPFYWNSRDDNSVYYSNGAAQGHIELENDWKNASGYVSTATIGEFDDDPKVSGIIYIDGTANDNVLLKELWLTFPGILDSSTKVAERTGGTWKNVSNNTAITFDADYTNNNDTFDNNTGNTIKWRIKIDTSKITNVAATDVTVQVRAIDRGKASLNEAKTEVVYNNSNQSASSTEQTTTATKTPYYRMDVVPYITGVETSISSFLAKDYTRSAVGDYPIKLTSSTGEEIKVSGFNLFPTNKAVDKNTVKSDVRLSKNKTALSGTTKQGTGLKVEAGSGTDDGKWLVTMSATGNGYLTFFTNEIPTLNNVDSEADYNKEESLIHASLNNDRKFTLWDFTALRSDTDAPNANGATYPSMAMNGDTPQFAYVNNVGGYGLAEFWNGTKETKIYENWDLFTYTSLALNSSGKRAALYDINVVQEGTGYASDSGGILTNFFNNPPDVQWNGNTYYFQSNNVWLDSLYKQDVTAVLGRYEYPTIKLVGNDNMSHVFYSVYDSLDDRVVFRYFTVGTGIANNARNKINSDSTLYVNKNQLNQRDVNGNWPDYSTEYGDTNKRFSNYGTRTATSTAPKEFEKGKKVGLYTATAGVPVNAQGTPVIVTTGNVTAARGILVYYAGTDMYYTYAKNNANTTWSTPVVLDSNCEASYISMVVDGANHVHIAYQDNIAGDVKYIYIPTYSDPDTRKMVTVDSYLTVGDKLTLDVVGSTPYIGYKGLGNTAKVAWYVANNGVPDVETLTDSIDSDEKFTGSWNVEIIPNRIVDSDTNRFNVGVGRTNKRPVIGYSNNQSGSKGIEYLTRCADLAN